MHTWFKMWVGFWLAAGLGWAHLPEYAPFPPGTGPEQVSWEEWQPLPPADLGEPGDGLSFFGVSRTGAGLPAPARLSAVGGCGQLEFEEGGRTRQVAVPDPQDIPRVKLGWADLNGDGRPDAVLRYECWGNGLAAIGEIVTLVLSGRQGYRSYAVYQYGFSPENLVRFRPSGPVHLITSSLVSPEGFTDPDGYPSQYWVHQLFEVRRDRLVRTPAGRWGFPRWMYFRATKQCVERRRMLGFRRWWEQRRLERPREVRSDCRTTTKESLSAATSLLAGGHGCPRPLPIRFPPPQDCHPEMARCRLRPGAAAHLRDPRAPAGLGEPGVRAVLRVQARGGAGQDDG